MEQASVYLVNVMVNFKIESYEAESQVSNFWCGNWRGHLICFQLFQRHETWLDPVMWQKLNPSKLQFIID